MKYSICGFAIAFVLISCPAEAEKLRSYTTIGARTCKAWNENNEAKKKLTTGYDLTWVQSATAEDWLLGYLSGYNANLYEQYDLLDGIDSETIKIWMDRYCLKNPNKGITEGANKLADELLKIVEKKARKAN